MKIALVCAIAENNAIGLRGALPWHLKGELALFRRITIGHAVIMGRRTYESLPRKPLPQRHNIVISRQKTSLTGATVTESFRDAMAIAQKDACYNDKPVMVIGGAEVFRLALPYASFYYRTLVQASPEADVYFHGFDASQWCLSEVLFEQNATPESFGYRAEKWQRHSGLETF